MVLALDGTAIVVSVVSMFGVVSVGYFGYLGLKAQVKTSSESIVNQVTNLDSLNTTQHGENAKILYTILDTIAEHGVIVASMMEANSNPMFKFNDEGSLIEVNAAAIKLVGSSREELLDDGWIKKVHEEDRADVYISWFKSIRNQSTFGPIVYRYKHEEDQRDILVEALAKPVINTLTGNVVSWISVLTPIKGAA